MTGALPILRPCRDDLPALVALLAQAGLPHDDLAPHLANFTVAEVDGELVGAGGYEAAGPGIALLRSFVVRPDWRGRGLGRRLFDAVVATADAAGRADLYLLTTSARDWFAGLGFIPVPRESAPAAIRATRQFAGACPASAALMRRPPGGADAGALWQSWQLALRRHVARRVREPADVDDVLQEVFLKLHGHRAGLREPGRLAAWLFRVADNAIADHYRGRKPWSALPDDLVAPAAEADSTAELAICLAPMIAALPETYREALQLSEIEGLTQKAVAERLGLTLSGAKSRVQRGREHLRGLMLACCHVEADGDGLASAPKPGGRKFC